MTTFISDITIKIIIGTNIHTPIMFRSLVNTWFKHIIYHLVFIGIELIQEEMFFYHNILIYFGTRCYLIRHILAIKLIIINFLLGL